MPARRIELAEVALPEFGLPETEPAIPPATYEARVAEARRRASAAGFDVLIVYGDREHFANLAYLTGFDPRFEEALLILAPDRLPSLLVGNEDMAYAAISPVQLQRVLYQTFSLISQPRGSNAPLETIFLEAGVAGGQRIGMAGWKYFLPSETSAPDQWIEAPAYLVDTLRAMGCDVRNATALFMEPESGMRAISEVDQLAFFEYSATLGSQGLRDMLFQIQPGMTEYDAARLMGFNGFPLSIHPLATGGPRARFGLASPSTRKLVIGDPMMGCYGPWGSNTARAGFLVEDVAQLPDAIQDCLEKLVIPYFTAIVAWYEHVGIGAQGGELYEAVHQHIGDPFFGVTLNPGHLVHLDEWVSSPIYRDSTQQLRSGMAVQVDVIPATGTAYHMMIVEDTILLADNDLRMALEQGYPDAWSRIQARRAFMQDNLGITLKPEVLPCSNLPAYLPPFWLSPQKAMRVV